jgi:hypothetical protein
MDPFAWQLTIELNGKLWSVGYTRRAGTKVDGWHRIVGRLWGTQA